MSLCSELRGVRCATVSVSGDHLLLGVRVGHHHHLLLAPPRRSFGVHWTTCTKQNTYTKLIRFRGAGAAGRYCLRDGAQGARVCSAPRSSAPVSSAACEQRMWRSPRRAGIRAHCLCLFLAASLSRPLALSLSRSLSLSLALSLSLSLSLALSLSLCPLPPLPHSLSRSRSRRNSSGIRLASPSLSPKPLLSRQVGHVASREEKRSAQCMGSDRSPIHARRSPLFAALGSRLLPARQRRTTPRAQLGCARSVGLPPLAQLRRSSSSRRLERSLASYEHIVSMRSRHW